jgi:hypothetical protein
VCGGAPPPPPPPDACGGALPPCPGVQVCVPGETQACGQQTANTCADPCTSTSCDVGDECPSETGICQPKSCKGGAFACAAHQTCEARGGDAHGCAVITCAVDDDCPTHHCVNGGCASGPGVCFAPPP